MKSINLKKEISGTVEDAIVRVTEALGKQGFGILTRIDFDSKIKEKLGHEIPRTVILGACNPQLAYEAVLKAPDVTSLLPCNAVVREIQPNRISIELAKPTSMMEILGDRELTALAETADARLQVALDQI